MTPTKSRAKRGLKPKILALFGQGYTTPVIAKRLDCTRANVNRVLKRAGIQSLRPTWNGYIAPLPPKATEWLHRNAKKSGVSPSDLAKALLVDAIELAIEEQADMRDLPSNASGIARKPMPKALIVTKRSNHQEHRTGE